MIQVQEVPYHFEASVQEKIDLALPVFSFTDPSEGVITVETNNVATQYKEDISGNEWPMPSTYTWKLVITRTTQVAGIRYDQQDAIMKFCAEHRYPCNNQNQGNGWWAVTIVVTRESPWVTHG